MHRPPATSARYTSGLKVDSAAAAMASANTTMPLPTSRSSPSRLRSGPITSPASTAPVPRQPMRKPKPVAPSSNRRAAITGSSAHKAEPVAL